MTQNTIERATVAAPQPVRSSYRWTICVLLFFATTINYMDRQILGILAKELQTKIGWSELQYSYIVMAFQAAYAIGLVGFGWLIDRFGTKIGYTLAIVIWSIAAAAHALAHSVLGFGAARFALGIGEAGNFPAAIKAVTEWFPRKERALATGLFNAGSNIGAIIAPLIVPAIAIHWGWQAAFVVLGASGLIWIAAWLLLYDKPERHRRVSAEELEYIESDKEVSTGTKLPWALLAGFRQTWAYVIPSAVVSPIWWFYLYWLPKFFGARYGLDLSHIGAPLVIVYSMAMVGSITGGWLSSFLLRQGWTVNAARKTAMLVFVCCVVPVASVTYMDHVGLATFLAGLAMFGHQGLSANLYTMVSDLFPKRAVASVVGLGSAFGSVTAIGFSYVVGWVLNRTGSYSVPFISAAVGYPVVLLVLHLLAPRWKPLDVEVGDAARGFPV